MNYIITPEQLNGLNAFINGEEHAVLDVEAARAMFAMSAALASNIIKENRALRSERLSLQRRLERMAERKKETKQSMLENEWFAATGLDSLDVAKAFLYQLQENGFTLSKDKFWSLIFMAYSSYLFHLEATLFIEHPVAILIDKDGKKTVGIRFWRMKDLSVTTPVGHDVWVALAGKSPKVAKFLQNFVLKYGNYTEDDLRSYVIRSEPVRKAFELMSVGGPKSRILSDKDIYLWKESQKH